jgi:hypothetical protein
MLFSEISLIILFKKLLGIHSGIYPTTSFINERKGLDWTMTKGVKSIDDNGYDNWNDTN